MAYNEYMKSILEALNWRYATKVFDKDKKVSDVDLAELLEALRLTPSSFGLQPWKFIVVKDPAVRAKLRAVAWDQSAVTDASYFIIFTALRDMNEAHADRFLGMMSETTGTPIEKLAGYKKMILDFISAMDERARGEWNARQVYIALGELLTLCAVKEIDACPMEGFDPQKFDEILGLANTPYTTRVACAIGYRSSEDKYALAKKVRFNKDEVISEN